MKAQTAVTWTDAAGNEGSGITIFDEDASGHILVAVDAPPNMPHMVIYCAVTWLTPKA